MVTWLESTPDSAATEVEMSASRAFVKASIGSAATKPITTWYVGGGGGGARRRLLKPNRPVVKPPPPPSSPSGLGGPSFV